MQKPKLPKGTRDFSPLTMAKRNHIFDIIRKTFETYGFQPIETPAFETLETLTGKYGDEGDKLIFKILNSGNYLNKITENTNINNIQLSELTKIISEKALKYDLTVPFARYVVQNQNDITFPFKRYQIQPVWRADRPQKGRYREFYQCDVDVIGSNSLLNEVELIQIIHTVFNQLNLQNFTIKLNNRKILTGIAQYLDAETKTTDLTVALDKIDKVGFEGVAKELEQKEFLPEQIKKLKQIIDLQQNNQIQLEKLSDVLSGIDIGLEGCDEISQIYEYLAQIGFNTDKIKVDVSLARGLNYYTGAIFEVTIDNVKIGSVCGGGRYDNLTGIFGLDNMSGVGISFGADRIYDVLEQNNLFPDNILYTTEIFIPNFGNEEEQKGLEITQKLRAEGFKTEFYPEPAKMKKQLSYANKKNIPFVLLVGSEELASGKYNLKNMHTGTQEKLPIDEIIHKLHQKL